MWYAVALALAMTAVGTRPGVPDAAARAVTGAIPKGWSATVTGDTITVRRERAVQVTSAFARNPVEHHYEFILTFRPHLTQSEYTRRHNENRGRERTLSELRDALRAAGVTERAGEWFPATDEQAALVAAYRAERNKLHRLPSLYSGTHSIDVRDSLGPLRRVADEAEARECEATFGAVWNLFTGYWAERP